MRKFLLAALFIPLSAIADPSGVYETNPQTADEYLNSISAANINTQASDKSDDTVWEKGLRNIAFSFGVKSGAYWQARNVLDYLTYNQKTYDAAVRFEPLLIRDGDYKILPAVVSEDNGREVISENGRVLRILDKTFIIISNAKFVYGPPNWRDYLYIVPEKPSAPMKSALPNSDKEREIWDEEVTRGWDVGVKSVEYTMRTRFARMARDYIGMVRYHILLKNKMVTSPAIRSKSKSVTGNGEGSVMNINDKVLTITALPTLNMKQETWIALSRLPLAAGMFPRGIEDQVIDFKTTQGDVGHMQPKLEIK